MGHMMRILADHKAQGLEKIAGDSESILTKVACSMLKEGMDGGGLSFPENPVLVAAAQQMAQNPEMGAGPYQDILSQILQADLQNVQAKIQMKGSMNPVRMEADRLRSMADLMRSKMDLMRYQKDMAKLQKEMAMEMGMAPENVAVQSMGQMPQQAAAQAQQPKKPAAPKPAGQGRAPAGPAPAAQQAGAPMAIPG